MTRNLENIEIALKGQDNKLNNYISDKYEYSRCKNNIKLLQRDYKVTYNNLNELKLQMSNDAVEKYFNNQLKINNSDIVNLDVKSNIKIDKSKAQTIREEKKEYFKDYKMNDSKLDNLEKYGVNFVPKKSENVNPSSVVNIKVANETLNKKASQRKTAFGSIKRKLQEQLENLSYDSMSLESANGKTL